MDGAPLLYSNLIFVNISIFINMAENDIKTVFPSDA